MSGEHSHSPFIRHGHILPAPAAATANIPFKDHAQLSVIIDALCRRDRHHVMIVHHFSPRLCSFFLSALQMQLIQESTPQRLRKASILCLDHISLQNMTIDDIQHTLAALTINENYVVIALSDIPPSSLSQPPLKERINTLFTHPQCRLLLFTSAVEEQIIEISIPNVAKVHLFDVSETEINAILQQQRLELETFHRVLIPEELIPLAYTLAERYLSTHDTLEQTLLLLDTSAARAGANTNEASDHTSSFTPVLTTAGILAVLSNWTHIPASHLHPAKIKFTELMEGMHSRLYGQDHAISLISHELQQTQSYLQHRNGPLCGFLFVGSQHTGKKTAALALTEQLFKQLHPLHFAQPTAKCASLLDVKMQQCINKRQCSLAELILTTPYAVLMFENIELFYDNIQDDLHELFHSGFIHDKNGCRHDFRQAIFVFSTTLASEKLAQFALPDTNNEEPQLDLMQLVMNEQRHQSAPSSRILSPQELAHEITSSLHEHLPAALTQHLMVTPFVPLTKSALEKIMRLKLKVLNKQLESRYHIELGYAPEVIRYLANQAALKQSAASHLSGIDNVINQLHLTIEHTVVLHADKPRPAQLFVQLNETGQTLRCDWLTTVARQHAL